MERRRGRYRMRKTGGRYRMNKKKEGRRRKSMQRKINGKLS